MKIPQHNLKIPLPFAAHFLSFGSQQGAETLSSSQFRFQHTVHCQKFKIQDGAFGMEKLGYI